MVDAGSVVFKFPFTFVVVVSGWGTSATMHTTVVSAWKLIYTALEELKTSINDILNVPMGKTAFIDLWL
jgi:hypothetical protein